MACWNVYYIITILKWTFLLREKYFQMTACIFLILVCLNFQNFLKFVQTFDFDLRGSPDLFYDMRKTGNSRWVEAKQHKPPSKASKWRVVLVFSAKNENFGIDNFYQPPFRALKIIDSGNILVYSTQNISQKGLSVEEQDLKYFKSYACAKKTLK